MNLSDIGSGAEIAGRLVWPRMKSWGEITRLFCKTGTSLYSVKLLWWQHRMGNYLRESVYGRAECGRDGRAFAHQEEVLVTSREQCHWALLQVARMLESGAEFWSGSGAWYGAEFMNRVQRQHGGWDGVEGIEWCVECRLMDWNDEMRSYDSKLWYTKELLRGEGEDGEERWCTAMRWVSVSGTQPGFGRPD